MATADRLVEIRARLEAIRAEAREEAGAVFTELAKELFAAHPVLEHFSWTQYTPYFNDGSTCEFGVNHDSPRIKFVGLDEDDVGVWDFRAAGEVKYQPQAGRFHGDEPKQRAFEAVRTFLNTFTEDDYGALFGDHVEVIVSPRGTRQQPYDHD